jgi:hypothetical protein
MNTPDEDQLPDFERLSREKMEKMMSSPNAKQNIDEFLENLVDTSLKHMSADIDEAKQITPKQRRPKEALADFDEKNLVSPPVYKKKTAISDPVKKTSKPSPSRVESISDKIPEPSKHGTVIDKAPKKSKVETRSPEFAIKKKAVDDKKTRIQKAVPPKKKAVKAKAAVPIKDTPKVSIDDLKTKKVDAKALEERFKERQKKIQDIFDQNKGNVS